MTEQEAAEQLLALPSAVSAKAGFETETWLNTIYPEPRSRRQYVAVVILEKIGSGPVFLSTAETLELAVAGVAAQVQRHVEELEHVPTA